MYKQNKKFIIILTLLWLVIPLLSFNIKAMHIMEGYLPIEWSIIWNVLTFPFLIISYHSIKELCKDSTYNLLLLALATAYVFVISALKLPSVGGSSSHATGIALGALLIGPKPMSLVGLIVLLFQALLLSHGGITTLGANIFSMAIVGAFSASFSMKLCLKLKINTSLSVIIATIISSLLTYTTTSLQLSLAFPGDDFLHNFIKFISIFALTQIPIAIIEGIVTSIIYENIHKKNDNKELFKYE